MAQTPVCEKAILFFFVLRWASCQKSCPVSLARTLDVHPLRAGAGVNLILSARRRAFQTQSVAFVCFCSSVKQDKQGSGWKPAGWWISQPSYGSV